jgi:hypothetical protein
MKNAAIARSPRFGFLSEESEGLKNKVSHFFGTNQLVCIIVSNGEKVVSPPTIKQNLPNSILN